MASLATVAGFVAVLWIVGLLNLALGYQWNEFGVVPRTAHGLAGVPLAPFLHGDLRHLAVNTVSFVILGSLVAVQGGSRRFLLATACIILVGGLLLWVFGRSAAHIGASGLIFGYFGYLVARAFTTPSFVSVAVAAVVVFFHGANFALGLLPLDRDISWEGHLTGLVAGVMAARLFRDERASRRR